MLLFLKPRKLATVIIAQKKAEGGLMNEHEEGELHPHLLAAAADLIHALTVKDAQLAALALQEAFEVCDSLPHVEGEHEEEEKE